MSVIFVALFALSSCAQGVKELPNEKDSRYYRPLTAAEKDVIERKGTEAPFSGSYDDFYADGLYVCRRCGAELYWSTDKFNSDCGWPSFDDEIPGAVSRVPDGMRTEITCTQCGAHLGHVFLNEGFTEKNTRHCVNSISLKFIPARAEKGARQDTAIFAGGCFWGVEYYLEQAQGVIDVEDGYIGGHKENPTYEDVCSNLSGYAEAVRVVFDPAKTDFETLARLFFEIHDPTQVNRQGPDIGDQYRSEIFYKNVEQKQTAEKLIDILEQKGYEVATRVTPASMFYSAEAYHQDYYERKGGTPYCHNYTKRF
ncbi:bifunctional methionine sulfoxide reductase B/A protein [Mangrovibacterium sp.]|uniref:bifunctional methionine sulfoxide reductase B/A protein n=1 Tax=Mangrovibacterium sp. TaxID=1961364 RepID=UPI0035639EDD